MRYLSPCCSCFLPHSPLSSARRPIRRAGPLTGRVVDPTAGRLPRARVLLLGHSGSVASTTTNASGEFTLTAPDSGRVRVRVAVEGFRAEPIAVEGSTGDARPRHAALWRVSAVSESLVVSAAQVEIPLSRAYVERDGDHRRRTAAISRCRHVADALRRCRA